jgi:hypothetical protein
MKWKARDDDWFQLNTKGFPGGRQPATHSCGGAIGTETGLRQVDGVDRYRDWATASGWGGSV